MAVSKCHWPTYWCRMALAHNSSLFLYPPCKHCKEIIWPGIVTVGGNCHGEGFSLESVQNVF
ncbi:hypothetical protein J1N35_042242 [Gossypium stocksii]|uniref:Uncharacterized protein n=1 Tax=Gossypium stocksii TaxID=47602 RepID=A0A9D3ZKE4_9ROSI|nr:hypothetical protein J1N35_042242 [Gossypium stocksii]